jgi:hypothetical protein
MVRVTHTEMPSQADGPQADEALMALDRVEQCATTGRDSKLRHSLATAQYFNRLLRMCGTAMLHLLRTVPPAHTQVDNSEAAADGMHA